MWVSELVQSSDRLDCVEVTPGLSSVFLAEVDVAKGIRALHIIIE